VDLFGDHPVQVAQAALETAIVLALATLIVLLSVRAVARRSAWTPTPAIATPMYALRIVRPGRDEADIPSARRALGTSLPTRAPPQPPDPAQRFCPAPSGRFRRRRMT
jgi:hypothetical protein